MPAVVWGGGRGGLFGWAAAGWAAAGWAAAQALANTLQEYAERYHYSGRSHQRISHAWLDPYVIAHSCERKPAVGVDSEESPDERLEVTRAAIRKIECPLSVRRHLNQLRE